MAVVPIGDVLKVHEQKEIEAQEVKETVNRLKEPFIQQVKDLLMERLNK